MTTVFMVAIIFGGIVLALAIVGGTILLAIQMRHGGFRVKRGGSEAEEARIVQEIHQGLSKLEERVEALETILMDMKERDTDS